MPYIAIVHVPDGPHRDGVIARMHCLPEGYRLVALFDFPNRAELKCTGNCVRKGSGAWSRDRRGFMKCSICGSRNRRLRQWLIGHLFDLLGANLYEQAPAAFRTPEGYGDFPR